MKLADLRRIERLVRPTKRRRGGPKGYRRHLVRILVRDGLSCRLCGGNLADVDLDLIHVDHVVPRARGGSDDLDNLQATHARCNLSKGSGCNDRARRRLTRRRRWGVSA